MQVKIDTKEKFHVITILEPKLTANMTAEIHSGLSNYLQNDVKNVVLNLNQVEAVEMPAMETLIKVQQSYYENNASFVVCEIQPAVEQYLDEQQLLEILSATPTESEAWDIVQMEEIERELLDDDEPLFNND
ncbi:STAS domain-containing protein [Flavihumibacter sp. CACIAM 22H1]|uniref:STAS domain-containing protein n=1 Tax=Flavihumibacter sp. CACIAM 22H1 TaxID=1812911 RepID=UPI0007A8C930|nr:STAS domain-containing protein [Flavihumibacter sp. CACIAM 22H1]KYP16043.1 MAG: anti-anti-sigma factor [Flavihumibacter sp. CACIAM 22H1]